METLFFLKPATPKIPELLPSRFYFVIANMPKGQEQSVVWLYDTTSKGHKMFFSCTFHISYQ